MVTDTTKQRQPNAKLQKPHHAKHRRDLNFKPINCIFGASLPYDTGRRKPFDFEQNHPELRMVVEGPKFWPNDKRYEKFFRLATTATGWEIDMFFLLYTTRKSYMGSPAAPLDLILSDLESSVQGHSDFEAFYLIQRLCYIHPMLLHW